MIVTTISKQILEKNNKQMIAVKMFNIDIIHSMTQNLVWNEL